MAAQSSAKRKGSGFDTGSVALLALAVLLFLYALSLFLQGGFLSAQKVDHHRKLDLSGDPALQAHEADQRDLLNAKPTWIDRDAGKVSIPIETAKEQLLEQLAGGTGGGHE